MKKTIKSTLRTLTSSGTSISKLFFNDFSTFLFEKVPNFPGMNGTTIPLLPFKKFHK